MTDPTADADSVPYIAHDEFRAGLPYGRFRIVVNPKLSRPYVVQRTRIDFFAVAVIGAGAVVALSGAVWIGGALVAVGIAANRLVRNQSGKILLHLAARDAAVYHECTAQGVMEVRRSN